MIKLCLIRDFPASHRLVGGDWGAENQLHTHNYRLEWELAGEALNQHGFLLDLVQVENRLTPILAHYQNQVLNDLPEFQGLNPSVERLALALWEDLAQGLSALGIKAMVVRLWEHPNAWAAVEQDLW